MLPAPGGCGDGGWCGSQYPPRPSVRHTAHRSAPPASEVHACTALTCSVCGALLPPHMSQCHVSVTCVCACTGHPSSIRPAPSRLTHATCPPLSPAERCHIERSHHTSHVPTHTSSSNASSRACFRCGRRPLPEQWTRASGSDRYTREAREGGDLTQTSQPCEARPRCAPPAPAHARPALPAGGRGHTRSCSARPPVGGAAAGGAASRRVDTERVLEGLGEPGVRSERLAEGL